MNPDLVRNYLTGLQDRLCATFEEVDGKAKFISDEWQRAEGGGGRTRVIADIRASEEGREGVQAFLQKRKPNWLL